MASAAQARASRKHRQRGAERGLVRVEVQAPSADAALIRDLARTLRSDPERAANLRSTIRTALGNEKRMSALEAFASDLPDEDFEGVFDQPRDDEWREIDW